MNTDDNSIDLSIKGLKGRDHTLENAMQHVAGQQTNLPIKITLVTGEKINLSEWTTSGVCLYELDETKSYVKRIWRSIHIIGIEFLTGE